MVIIMMTETLLALLYFAGLMELSFFQERSGEARSLFKLI